MCLWFLEDLTTLVRKYERQIRTVVQRVSDISRNRLPLAAARLEAMITDPVYEGKSMAGLIDLVSRGEIARSSNVLYAHLGGQPAINGYASLFS